MSDFIHRKLADSINRRAEIRLYRKRALWVIGVLVMGIIMWGTT